MPRCVRLGITRRLGKEHNVSLPFDYRQAHLAKKILASREARSEEQLLNTRSKNKLQRQLQNAWIVSCVGLQEPASGAAGITG